MALPYILGDNFVVVRRLSFLWAQNAARLVLDALLLLLLLLWGFQGVFQNAIWVAATGPHRYGFTQPLPEFRYWFLRAPRLAALGTKAAV